jgi:F0F1-type ATP synthase delta subunit
VTDSEQLVTAVATAAFPTIAALIGILVNNSRLNDVNQRFADTNRHIDDVKEILRAEMFRMEQVLDARLRHLEEHFQS